MRKWHKTIPMKLLHEQFGVYQGTWSRQMDRYWESDDGYTVSSRQIRTEIGVVEHVTIQKIGPDVRGGDIPWAVKQEIKEELFGPRTTAIEVFPAKKNLVDVLDIYHLWILPKDFKMPFGIHPTRDPQCPAVERGYDFNMAEAVAWNESPERKALSSGSPMQGILKTLEERGFTVIVADDDDEEQDFVREMGPVRVTWVSLGEGYQGDYDPDDPEDAPLLRFDVAIKNEETGEFDTVESRCTCIEESATDEEKEAALEYILEAFYEGYIQNGLVGVRFLADKLSHVSIDSVLTHLESAADDIRYGRTQNADTVFKEILGELNA